MNDSLHTLFLAQSMGLYLLIMAIVLLARAPYYRAMFSNLKPNNAGVFFASSFGLILGIILVLINNIWIMESEVLVTIIAWLVLIKSVLWLAFPQWMMNCTHKWYAGSRYYVIAVIMAILGVFLMAHGFYLFIPA